MKLAKLRHSGWFVPVVVGTAVIGLLAAALLVYGTVRNFGGAPAPDPVGVALTPAPAAAPPTKPPAVAPLPAPPATEYRKITAREWQLIAKAPDLHLGERIIVYGQVTQFDSATGASGMRANVDGVIHPVRYGYADYETNTVLAVGSAEASLLANVVKGDLFTARVVVNGSYAYDTQIGGSTTVPQLIVESIQVTGSAK